MPEKKLIHETINDFLRKSDLDDLPSVEDIVNALPTHFSDERMYTSAAQYNRSQIILSKQNRIKEEAAAIREQLFDPAYQKMEDMLFEIILPYAVHKLNELTRTHPSYKNFDSIPEQMQEDYRSFIHQRLKSNLDQFEEGYISNATNNPYSYNPTELVETLREPTDYLIFKIAHGGNVRSSGSPYYGKQPPNNFLKDLNEILSGHSYVLAAQFLSRQEA